MIISEVRFNGTKNKNFLAYVSCTVGGCLKLRDMRLVVSNQEASQHKMVIVMPKRVDADGNSVEVYHPINRELRTALEAAVFPAWERHVQKANV